MYGFSCRICTSVDSAVLTAGGCGLILDLSIGLPAAHSWLNVSTIGSTSSAFVAYVDSRIE